MVEDRTYDGTMVVTMLPANSPMTVMLGWPVSTGSFATSQYQIVHSLHGGRIMDLFGTVGHANKDRGRPRDDFFIWAVLNVKI